MSWIKNKQRKNLTEDLNSEVELNTFTTTEGWFDVLDDWIKKIVSYLLDGLDFFFFPLLILLLAVGFLGLLSSRVGILTGWQVPIWRVQTFLLRQFLLQQMLWVILFCFSGVLRSRISSGGANLGDSGILWRSTELRSYRFYAQAV